MASDPRRGLNQHLPELCSGEPMLETLRYESSLNCDEMLCHMNVFYV